MKHGIKTFTFSVYIVVPYNLHTVKNFCVICYGFMLSLVKFYQNSIGLLCARVRLCVGFCLCVHVSYEWHGYPFCGAGGQRYCPLIVTCFGILWLLLLSLVLLFWHFHTMVHFYTLILSSLLYYYSLNSSSPERGASPCRIHGKRHLIKEHQQGFTLTSEPRWCWDCLRNVLRCVNIFFLHVGLEMLAWFCSAV